MSSALNFDLGSLVTTYLLPLGWKIALLLAFPFIGALLCSQRPSSASL